MTKIADPFVLRADSANHSQDVRWVAAGPIANQILSCSRDKTARCFSFSNDSSDGFHDVLTPAGAPIEGHMGFVNFVMYHPSVPFLDGEEAIITGSNDKYLIFWSPTKGSMEAILGGHSDTVKCGAILYPSMDVVSGSWDKAAIVWDIHTGNIKQHALHHQQSVLAVAQVGPRNDAANQIVVTASGDRTLVAWNATTADVIRTFKGHTDSVQAVVAMGEEGRFASAANDGRIALWDLSSSTPLSVLQGHEAFVFGLCYLRATNELVSASDDRTVKVWGIDAGSNDLLCTQVINFPTTVWTVCAVADDVEGGAYKEGVVTGTADNTVRLWTRNLDMCAGAEKISTMEAVVSAQRIDVKALLAAGYKTDILKMPALAQSPSIDGEYEGERKLFRLEDNTVEMHTWVSTHKTWEKIGTIVMGDDQQPFRGVIPKQRFFFAGQEWDYLFDIDFGGGRTAKLPYNSGESIFDAAQRFINNNAALGAQQSHKEAIQNHILQGLSEEDLAKIGVSSGKGGGSGDDIVAYSAYAREAAEMARQGQQETPSWGQAKKQFEASGGAVAVSGFAQEEAAAQAAATRAATLGGAANSVSSPAGSPKTGEGQQIGTEVFAPYDPAVVKKKTAEFLGGSSQYDSLFDQAVATVVGSKGGDTDALAAATEGLAQLFAALGQGSRFPAIDTLRYMATTVGGASYIASADARCSELIDGMVASEKAFESLLSSDAEKLVALRLMANLAANATASANYASLLTKIIENAIRVMVKKATINVNQKAAAMATLQNAAVGITTLLSSSSRSSNDNDAAASPTTAVDTTATTGLIRSFFLATSEAILFEKDTTTQGKYLRIALTVVSSHSAKLVPAIKEHATRTLQRFCQGSSRHSDKQLAAPAAAIYQFVKPDDDDFE